MASYFHAGSGLVNGCIVPERVPDPKDTSASSPPQARRRLGGARRAATDRVSLKRGDQEIIGWTLNVSRGGARIVVEDRVEQAEQFTAVFADDDSAPRPVRVAWIQEEAGGQIVGLQFLDAEGTIPPQDPPDRDP